MPITVVTNPVIELPEQDTLEYTGLVSGGEVIVKVPPYTAAILCNYNPTSAGEIEVKYGLMNDTPTDFSDMPTTAIGTDTTQNGQEIQEGINWIGLKVNSGTWDFNVSFRQK